MAAVTGIVAGIGVRAIAGTVLGKAASAGTSVLKWLESLDLVHGLLLFACLFGAWQTWGRWSQHRHEESLSTRLTTAANALTAAQNHLATSQANEAKLRTAIATQNAAVEELGKQSAKQQEQAAKASQAAQERAQEAEAVADRLRAQTRPSGLKTAPAANCEPSDALKRQWP